MPLEVQTQTSTVTHQDLLQYDSAFKNPSKPKPRTLTSIGATPVETAAPTQK